MQSRQHVERQRCAEALERDLAEAVGQLKAILAVHQVILFGSYTVFKHIGCPYPFVGSAEKLCGGP